MKKNKGITIIEILIILAAKLEEYKAKIKELKGEKK